MKKILFLIAVIFTSVWSSRANIFTFLNMTACTHSISIRGFDPGTSQNFESMQITVPPGTITYSSPSDIPGLSGLSATVYYYHVKGVVNAVPSYGYAVGNASGMSTTASIPGVPCRPAGTNINFNGNSTGGNVVILIF